MSGEQPDLMDMLDSLAATLGHSPAAVEITDQREHGGHIVVWTDGAVRRGTSGDREYVAFLDMGSVLNLYSRQGVDLKPADARLLGQHLIAWADRRKGRP